MINRAVKKYSSARKIGGGNGGKKERAHTKGLE